ncbi:MAG: hypothetical protein CL759_06965 [Chloroflexi bacterium]|nr:hypothetical protein [Chloroflexota bacterium]|tara:strand:- start:2533 stop:2730 length:198 start_codon:yes stop_codon:yes gene_type:complete
MGLKKLFESYKGVAFLLSIIALTVLVALGKGTMDDIVAFLKWGFSALVVARAGEEGAKAIAKKAG